MNSRLKYLIESTMVHAGVGRIAQNRLQQSSVLILAYHDIVPAGASRVGDASLHLAQREFGGQLDLITRTHDVVPLDIAMDESLPAARPRVVITFDDAYAGALTAGVEELQSRRLPATVFVAPALLGETTWWDMLADERDGGVRSEVRDHALWHLAGRRDRTLEWAASLPSVSFAYPSARIATVAELESAAGYAGLTIGAHTWAHANLCALTAEELGRELTLPLEWLFARFPATLPMLSYPYGLFSREVEIATSRAGYTHAFRVDGGWMPNLTRADPFAIPRYNVPAGISLNGFRLRLAGIGAA